MMYDLLYFEQDYLIDFMRDRPRPKIPCEASQSSDHQRILYCLNLINYPMMAADVKNRLKYSFEPSNGRSDARVYFDTSIISHSLKRKL